MSSRARTVPDALRKRSRGKGVTICGWTGAGRRTTSPGEFVSAWLAAGKQRARVNRIMPARIKAARYRKAGPRRNTTHCSMWLRSPNGELFARAGTAMGHGKRLSAEQQDLPCPVGTREGRVRTHLDYPGPGVVCETVVNGISIRPGEDISSHFMFPGPGAAVKQIAGSASGATTWTAGSRPTGRSRREGLEVGVRASR